MDLDPTSPKGPPKKKKPIKDQKDTRGRFSVLGLCLNSKKRANRL